MDYYTINLYRFKCKHPPLKIGVLARTETTATQIIKVIEEKAQVKIKKKRKVEQIKTTYPPFQVEQEQLEMASDTTQGITHYLIACREENNEE